MAYELIKRTGRLRSLEASWLTRDPQPDDLLAAGAARRQVSAIVPPTDETGSPVWLYGALKLSGQRQPAWHRQPLNGCPVASEAHWSELSDASAEGGDIKDVWELSRLGWLYPQLRQWAAHQDDAVAEAIWRVIDDWAAQNPPYRGPNWMCGQETSLRAITIMFLTDALRDSPTTTDDRRAAVAELIYASVGRVAPTIGYALSQRNNHAISEASFIWTASLLMPALPDATRLRRRAAQALTEAVADQFADDGSYSQHSPTYQRVALHVLLWCRLVSRTTGEPLPHGVEEATRRSVPFLRSLMAPRSEGRVPNLGGNDGALVFALTSGAIGDFRPVVAHAAAATGQPTGFGPGPWDEEARWFGLEPVDGDPVEPVPTLLTHPLTHGSAHAVVRAGPLTHRPAHADQLHTDIWLDGAPVAVDPGSYRYTAPAPWGNALAGDDVHNVPRRTGAPQAVRAGRFFWRRWAEAGVENMLWTDHGRALVARLQLPDGTLVRRFVAVGCGLVVVLDEADSDDVLVRWNLVSAASLERDELVTSVEGEDWSAGFRHGPGAVVPTRDKDDPASGWHSPTYGVLDPLTPLLLPVSSGGRVVSCFADRHRSADLEGLLHIASTLDISGTDDSALNELLRPT